MISRVRQALTEPQLALWASHCLNPDTPLLNEALVCELDQPVDVAAMRLAWQLTCEEHPILSAVVVADGEDIWLEPGVATVEMEVLDLRSTADLALRSLTPAARLERWLTHASAEVFDTDNGLTRVALLQIHETSWAWFLCQHHLISDAESMMLVWQRVAERYSAAGQLLSQPNAADARLQSATIDDVWTTSTPAPRTSPRGAETDVPLRLYHRQPSHLTTKATRLSVSHHAVEQQAFRDLIASPGIRSFSRDLTELPVWLTVLFAFLHRVTASRRLQIAMPVGRRQDESSRSAIGHHVELRSISTQVLPGMSFRELHGELRTALMAELKLSSTSGPIVDAGQLPVVLNYVAARQATHPALDANISWRFSGHIDPQHAMRVHVTDWNNTGDSTISLDFNDAWFNAAQRHRALVHWNRLWTAMLDNPDQLIDEVSVLSSDELEAEQGLCRLAARSTTPISERAAAGPESKSRVRSHAETLPAIPAHLRLICTQHPARTACREGTQTVTYAELDALAVATCLQLREIGVQAGDRVVLFVRRTLHLLPAILGIWRCGATFVPVDSTQPDARLMHILNDAGPRVILVDQTTQSRLPIIPTVDASVRQLESVVAFGREADASLPEPKGSLAHPAYILYTSGSTGQPKGVVVSHSALANYLNWANHTYASGSAIDMPLFTSIGFDLTVTSMFVPLMSGGTVHVYPESSSSAQPLFEVLRDNRVDTIKLTPAHLALLASEIPEHSRVRQLVVGGEDLKCDLAQRVHAAFQGRCLMHNEYGPTEATVGCITHTFDPDQDLQGSVPIGMPVAGTAVRVLDENGRFPPLGVPGELYLAGPSLADGYWRSADLTREAFVTVNDLDSDTATRWYRTGDRVRLNEAGSFDYLGRVDEQFSLKGVRANPAEIEAALLSVSEVSSCVAVVVGEDNNDGPERHCTQCGLSSRYPGATINTSGECSICVNFARYRDRAERYFRPMEELEQIARAATVASSGQYDCMMLLSGGKDSTYALCRTQDLGLSVLAFTLDNGFISDGAKENIRRVCASLGVDHEFASTPAMNRIFVDSLERFSNVCNGCFKTIYTLAMQRADELRIPLIVTGLSRGQFFETRLTEELFIDVELDDDAIDDIILSARKAYHRQDDEVSRLLDVTHFEDDGLFDRIRIIDFYRYCPVQLDDMLSYLDTRVPWVRPADTGRSTNCLINDIGIAVHRQERGFHNYSFPYSWDVRLGHKQRDEALEELDDDLDDQHVAEVLHQIGYTPLEPSSVDRGRLLLYYLSDSPLNHDVLMQHLARRLPTAMMPEQCVRLEHFPLTTNGKLDRSVLPIPATRKVSTETSYRAPISQVESDLCQVWSRLLGVERVGTTDNFFALGGDSLLAIRVTAAANQKGYRFLATDLFEHQSISALSLLPGAQAATDSAPDAHVDEVGALPAFSSLKPGQLDKLGKLLGKS